MCASGVSFIVFYHRHIHVHIHAHVHVQTMYYTCTTFQYNQMNQYYSLFDRNYQEIMSYSHHIKS